MADRFQNLRKWAPVLEKLQPDPNARLHYELMSSALMWSDELPSPGDREKLDVEVSNLRGVFRYRTTLILGKPEEKFREGWELLHTLCPHWPGFLPDRQRPDPSKIKLYEESRAKLDAEMKALEIEIAQRRSEGGKKPAPAV